MDGGWAQKENIGTDGYWERRYLFLWGYESWEATDATVNGSTLMFIYTALSEKRKREKLEGKGSEERN